MYRMARRRKDDTPPVAKGGFTPAWVESVRPPPRPRASRLAVRMAALFVVGAAASAGAALAWGASGRLLAAALTSLAVVAVSALVAVSMARRITAPLRKLVAGAERLGSSASLEAVPEQGPAELIELARAWNGASRRLAASAEQNRELVAQLERAYFETLRALVNAIEAKDSYTRGHSQRTAEFAVAIARRLGLDDAEVREVEFGGLLHDIGKIGIAEQILRKPARLDDDEMGVMRGHPRIGDGIVGDIAFLAPVRAMVRNHHERWDGRGYPDGLRAEEIPLGARIVSAADALDAITSDRCYQPGQTVEEAASILVQLSGKQLDPQVVDALLAVLRERGLLDGQAAPQPAALPERPRRVTLDFAVRRDDE